MNPTFARTPAWIIVWLALSVSMLQAQTSWDILSPGGNVRGTIQLADLSSQVGYPSGARLYYGVAVSGPSFVEATPPAPLGITRQDQAFVDGLVFDSISAIVTVDETYGMVTGKRRVIRNNATERSLHFHNASGARLTVVARAYDDGFAFRYVFPETNSSTFTVTGEATGFRVPASSTGWMMPHQAPAQFAPGYEDTYRQVTSGANSPNADGWSLPATFKTPGGVYVMIGETEVTPNYAGTRLQQSSTNSVYRIRLPNAAEGNSTGSVNPVWTLPWEMPWRFVIAGTSAGTILESNMPTNLASPSKVADVSWIRPGRSSWSWYSAEASPRTYS
ncbi:MAG TPA: glycoside hydrolase family 97 N-terminal domain-containing protein, partial [Fibrobacteria bacterium]|nr:glycoside hydrolase family 97 N-terminal domain-containing protein [Fibrobacteria bacterium]